MRMSKREFPKIPPGSERVPFYNPRTRAAKLCKCGRTIDLGVEQCGRCQIREGIEFGQRSVIAEAYRRQRYNAELEAGFGIPSPPQTTIRFRRSWFSGLSLDRYGLRNDTNETRRMLDEGCPNG